VDSLIPSPWTKFGDTWLQGIPSSHPLGKGGMVILWMGCV